MAKGSFRPRLWMGDIPLCVAFRPVPPTALVQIFSVKGWHTINDAPLDVAIAEKYAEEIAAGYRLNEQSADIVAQWLAPRTEGDGMNAKERYEQARARVEEFHGELVSIRVHQLANGTWAPASPREGQEMALMLLLSEAHEELVQEQLAEIKAQLDRWRGR